MTWFELKRLPRWLRWRSIRSKTNRCSQIWSVSTASTFSVFWLDLIEASAWRIFGQHFQEVVKYLFQSAVVADWRSNRPGHVQQKKEIAHNNDAGIRNELTRSRNINQCFFQFCLDFWCEPEQSLALVEESQARMGLQIWWFNWQCDGDAKWWP